VKRNGAVKIENSVSYGRNSLATREGVTRHKAPGRIDAGLLFIVFILICYGMIMLFSASMTEGFATEGNPLFFVRRQINFTIAGSVMALIIAFFVPVKKLDNILLTALLYIGTTLLLVMVFIPKNTPFIHGVELNGATRWLSVMGFRFQPSEVAKLSVVFCFAGYTSWIERRRKAGLLKKGNAFFQAWFDGLIDVVIPALAIGIWVAIVIFQPHISWVVIITVLSVFLFLSAKISWKSLVCGILILVILAVMFFAFLNLIMPLLPESAANYVNYDYVSTRLAIFLSPESVSEAEIFQTRQSINAIGSGGLTGVGIGNSIQKWGYLPMQYNDYVYSIIAEELGFIGAISIILLFLIYFAAGVRIALKSDNVFCGLIAFGFSLIIVIQAMLNIGVATNVLPPTGISLPFFSYGGSAILFSLLGIGLLLGVSKSGLRLKRKRE